MTRWCAPWTKLESIPVPVSRCSTSSRKSVLPPWNPVRYRGSRSSSPGRGLLVFQAKAKLLYDGAELNLPTLHGVVVRRSYASAHPDVRAVFLQAQLDATEFRNEKPLQAARIFADAHLDVRKAAVLSLTRWAGESDARDALGIALKDSDADVRAYASSCGSAYLITARPSRACAHGGESASRA